MQHLVIFEAEPRGLPLGERLLPEYLRDQGYRTHAVGKWHLGFYRREYTPTFRGFDSHYGYYQGFQDYYDHSVRATVSHIVRAGNRRKPIYLEHEHNKLEIYETKLVNSVNQLQKS